MFVEVVLLCVAVCLAVYRWRRRREYELAEKIGGEKTLPILGHLHKYAGDNENVMEAMKNVSYYSLSNGGISTLWLGHVLYFVMTDPVDIEYVLKIAPAKDDLERFFRVVVGNGVVFAPVPIWKVRRKIIVPAFSPKIVDGFVDVFSEQSEILNKQLKKRVNAEAFDLWPYFSSYTLDSVSQTVMGTRIEAQTNENPQFLESLNLILNITCSRIFQIWLHNDFIFKIACRFNDYWKHLSHLTGFVDGVVNNKRKELASLKKCEPDVVQPTGLESYNRRTFLDLLIENSGKTNGYSDLELREEVLTLTVAGTDTSAVAMSFTLLMLGRHPDIQEKVYQELVDIYGNSDRPLVKEDLSKMVYLERVIKETLRLYPPVPFITRKLDKETVLPSGKMLPAGAGVPISIFGVHRNKQHWGPDAETFDPDRFTPERYARVHPCAFIPFAAGLRSCLGYQYAMHSIKTAISTVLRKYKVSVPEGSLKQDIRVKLDIMMKAVTGYQVILQERSTSY